MTLDELSRIKKILREDNCPFFEDEEILFYVSENNDINDALYQMLIVKSEDTTLNVSGLTCADTSKYFRRLAQHYRKSNSCNLV
jgi:hypothetical protein